MSILPYNKGNIPEYRFYMSYASSLTCEVFPLNFLSTSLIDALETNHVFYRRKLAGSLMFGTNSNVKDVLGITHNRKDDWLYFWGIEQTTPCLKLYFTITKTVSGVTDIYWEGYFSTSDGKFDIDNCTFEVTPTTEDEYIYILEEAAIQHDMATLDFHTVELYINDVFYVSYPTGIHWLTKSGEDNLLEYLAGEIKPGATLSTHFFRDANNPVTGDVNRLTECTIAQKSDIIYINPNPPASAPQTLISWNELMDILWTMFQVTWDYDETTDTINVEHISWFGHDPGLDLRNQQVAQHMNKFSYLKETMPKYENFEFMEANSEPFVGAPIWYDSLCVDQDPDSNAEDHSVKVTTDIEYIYTTPDNIDIDGFVIFATHWAPGWIILNNFTYPNLSFHANSDLSWYNLHECFFKYNRVLDRGYLNGNEIDFYSTIKSKKQNCKAIICDDFDPNDEITTELGEDYLSGEKASVLKASIRPTGETDLELVYGLPCVVPAGHVNGFGVYGRLSITTVADPNDNFKIHFSYTGAIAVDKVARVRELVYDNLGVLNYTGGWEDCTFLAGISSTTITHVLETPLAAGWTIQIEIEYTGADIDIMQLESVTAFSHAIPFIYDVL